MYIHITQLVSYAGVFPLTFENLYVYVLWNNVTIFSIFLTYKKSLFSKCSATKAERSNLEKHPSSLFFYLFSSPGCLPVCGGLLSSCTYYLLQHSRHCFSLSCPSIINMIENTTTVICDLLESMFFVPSVHHSIS